MTHSVILGRASCALAVLAAFAVTVPARADVLEIGDNGPRWIAGPLVEQAPALPEVDSSMMVEDVPIELPLHVIADPARHAAGVPSAYSAKVMELAARFDLSPALLEAVVWQESRWRPGAVSPVGARGLAQLMPGTAREMGVNPDDPMANLEGGARYLRQQLDRFNGDLEKALAAYNAGPGRVIAASGIPDIRETRLYVAAILGRLAGHSAE